MANKKPQQPTYSREFRETPIKLALTGNKTIADVARELELPEWKLYGWVQSWRKKNGKAAGKNSVEEELRRFQKRYNVRIASPRILTTTSPVASRKILS